MNYERGELLSSREEGSIVISHDSQFPNTTLYNGTNLVEFRGTHDMKSEVRSGVGWRLNRFEIFREVNPDGEVVDWKFVTLPQLTTETEEVLGGLINNVRTVSGGKGRVEILREIGGKLPRIVMEKKGNGIKVITPGVASLHINDINASTKESESFDEPADSEAIQKAQYVSFELPLKPRTFFPEEINNWDRYFIKSQVKLLQGSQEFLREKIQEIIQNGSYTENRLRSLVNISFSLGKFYEEESFCIT